MEVIAFQLRRGIRCNQVHHPFKSANATRAIFINRLHIMLHPRYQRPVPFTKPEQFLHLLHLQLVIVINITRAESRPWFHDCNKVLFLDDVHFFVVHQQEQFSRNFLTILRHMGFHSLLQDWHKCVVRTQIVGATGCKDVQPLLQIFCKSTLCTLDRLLARVLKQKVLNNVMVTNPFFELFKVNSTTSISVYFSKCN